MGRKRRFLVGRCVRRNTLLVMLWPARTGCQVSRLRCYNSGPNNYPLFGRTAPVIQAPSAAAVTRMVAARSRSSPSTPLP
jgi:hypothetical protein